MLPQIEKVSQSVRALVLSYLSDSRGRKNRLYDEIDPKVKPLVDAMNETGFIETFASCQGHVLHSKPPYVAFKASVEVSAEIQKLLVDPFWRYNPALNCCWTIEASFNGRYELSYCLFSKKYNALASGGLFSWGRMALARKCMDQDLLTLANIVRQAILPMARKIHMQEIVNRANHDRQAK